ncbi:hypothetical protein EMIT0210MI2_260008 [Priestia megaterium]
MGMKDNHIAITHIQGRDQDHIIRITHHITIHVHGHIIRIIHHIIIHIHITLGTDMAEVIEKNFIHSNYKESHMRLLKSLKIQLMFFVFMLQVEYR